MRPGSHVLLERRLPVASAERAIGRDPGWPGGTRFDEQRTVAIAAKHPASPLDISSQHFPVGMAEAVTVADGEDYGMGLYSGDKGRE